MEWISVKDKLPNENSDEGIMVIIPKEEQGKYYEPFSCDYDGTFYDVNDPDNYFSNLVSHWMPLPKPPKK